MAAKLVIDTDIGTDVDDAFAVLFALASAEVDVAAVTLVHGDLDVRARISAKLLALAGRPDIPVYRGLREPISGVRPVYWAGHEGAGIDLSGGDSVRVEDGGVDAIIRLAAEHGQDLVVASIGPMTNVAAAIRKAPEVMRGIQRLYVMGSTFNGVGPVVTGREHNVATDPEAAAEVFASGIPITLVGLNVTLRVTLPSQQVDRMSRGSLLGEFMAAMAERWFNVVGKRVARMHDPLAIAAICKPSLIRTRAYSAEVLTEGDESGKVIFSKEGGPMLDVAVDVDVPAFDRLFLARIFSLV